MEPTGRVALAELAVAQWGLVTTAQAVAAGVSRVLLSRMAARGELERVIHGVYATPGAASAEHAELRALWLALDPERSAEDRLAKPQATAVISHATAAGLHGLGDLLDDVVEVTVPTRRQSRRDGLRIHVAELEAHEVTIVAGLPVTTVARTIADLVAEGHDVDHIATVMAEGIDGGLTDLAAVGDALKTRLGASRAGAALAQLRAAAGLDDETIDRALARTVAERWPGVLEALPKFAIPPNLVGAWTDQQGALAEVVRKFDTAALANLLPKLDALVGVLPKFDTTALTTALPKLDPSTLSYLSQLAADTQSRNRDVLASQALASLSRAIAATTPNTANRSALDAIKAARNVATVKRSPQDAANDPKDPE